VVTHGFTVDGDGKKISKSLGNDVDTNKLVKQHGAEILRLWTVMVDYREDMRFSEEMLKRASEAYRKVRNTCRYLVSNLHDFDPEQDALAADDLQEIDHYALSVHDRFVRRVLAAYDSYEFQVIYHQLVQYCSVDLSSFYLDVIKDRLYCEDGTTRRAAQSVLYRIADDLVRLMAPILPFTSDEVWPHVPGRSEDSVHLALFRQPEGEPVAAPEGWESLREVRGAVTKALEEARAAKSIGASLEARVRVGAPPDTLAELRRYEQTSDAFPGRLASLFIVSAVELAESDGDVTVAVERAPGTKCERCWTWSERVGESSVHPGVCERCAAVLEAR
jgi:isoleucyl-tRNA synthetase